MKNTFISLFLFAALLFSLAACGKAVSVEDNSKETETQVTSDVQIPTEDAGLAITPKPAESSDHTDRQDGERFEAIIMIEGMEEFVH